MKQILPFIFSLLISLHSYSQSIRFANVIGSQTFEYGISGNNVIRFDTAGNTIWSKNFSGQITASAFTNQLVSSAFDGNFLYVIEIQGWVPYSSTPHTYNGAIIIMDTSGNVLHVLTNSVYPGGGYNMDDVWPGFNGGAWVFDNYSPGISHLSNAILINSNGTFGPSLNFWYGGISHFKKLHPMADSTYIAIVNEEEFGWQNSPALTKFNRNGGVIWRRNFNTNLTNYDRLYESVSTHDSSGNVYLMCSWYNDTINDCAVGLKVNSSGNVVLCKYWPDLSPTFLHINDLRLENNQIICRFNSTEIFFDTLFNNNCLSSQNLTTVISNYYQSNGGPQQYLSNTFTPSQGSTITYTSNHYPDYCSTLSTNKEIYSEFTFDIGPNPATTSCIIRCPSNFYSLIRVFDIYGKLILENRFIKEFTFDAVNAGIYFVSVENKMGKSTKRIVVY